MVGLCCQGIQPMFDTSYYNFLMRWSIKSMKEIKMLFESGGRQSKKVLPGGFNYPVDFLNPWFK